MRLPATERLRIGQLFERQSNRDWIYLIRLRDSNRPFDHSAGVPIFRDEAKSRNYRKRGKKKKYEKYGRTKEIGLWCGRIESLVANKVVLSRESREENGS